MDEDSEGCLLQGICTIYTGEDVLLSKAQVSRLLKYSSAHGTARSVHGMLMYLFINAPSLHDNTTELIALEKEWLGSMGAITKYAAVRYGIAWSSLELFPTTIFMLSMPLLKCLH